MKVNIVPIGNSKGIRLPKNIITQFNIENKVDLEIDDGKIIIMPTHEKPRKGWDKQLKKMKINKEDKLVIDDKIDIEMENWEW